ncbi:putative YigZ family protein [Orbus hercynius]|uniref:Putative YigZ family protein n=1 Tax=Orbus hercynius TaxID=593135 RepID=A0A495RJG7_9GAMM|nr:YigZ family protein [Orbus hercynius]RKS87444.1 putative YigZ family protein [Orbus hercynius]
MLYTLINPYSITEEVKKSRFVVNAAPIGSAEQASQFIEAISDLSATHNCWAWKLGQQYRFSDDGEPTSTAGRPILAAIEGQNCDQVVVVVTRYFGGIKLGTGGLMRAYGGSASHCLQQAALTPIILRLSCSVSCLYSEWPILENRLKEADAIIEEQTFDATGSHLRIALTADKIDELNTFIANLSRGREKLTVLQ